tara:strand:+ start:13806 stop:14015 length:210 start_codon:yes stop_codon:yes gene_type:complete
MYDSHCIARGLQNHVVLGGEGVGEFDKMVAVKQHTAQTGDLAILQYHDFGESPVNIQTKNTHISNPPGR